MTWNNLLPAGGGFATRLNKSDTRTVTLRGTIYKSSGSSLKDNDSRKVGALYHRIFRRPFKFTHEAKVLERQVYCSLLPDWSQELKVIKLKSSYRISIFTRFDSWRYSINQQGQGSLSHPSSWVMSKM
jgi:hypothetical protein